MKENINLLAVSFRTDDCDVQQQSTADGLIVTDVVDASASVAGGIGMTEMAAETTEQTAHLHDVGYEGEGDQEQNRLQREEYAFEPNAESLSEVRQRINVGWMAGPNENSTDYDWLVFFFLNLNYRDRN